MDTFVFQTVEAKILAYPSQHPKRPFHVQCGKMEDDIGLRIFKKTRTILQSSTIPDLPSGTK